MAPAILDFIEGISAFIKFRKRCQFLYNKIRQHHQLVLGLLDQLTPQFLAPHAPHYVAARMHLRMNSIRAQKKFADGLNCARQLCGKDKYKAERAKAYEWSFPPKTNPLNKTLQGLLKEGFGKKFFGAGLRLPDGERADSIVISMCKAVRSAGSNGALLTFTTRVGS